MQYQEDKFMESIKKHFSYDEIVSMNRVVGALMAIFVLNLAWTGFEYAGVTNVMMIAFMSIVFTCATVPATMEIVTAVILKIYLKLFKKD